MTFYGNAVTSTEALYCRNFGKQKREYLDLSILLQMTQSTNQMYMKP